MRGMPPLASVSPQPIVDRPHVGIERSYRDPPRDRTRRSHVSSRRSKGSDELTENERGESRPFTASRCPFATSRASSRS